MTSRKSITLSSGKWGVILTIAIIAIRAFQANAEPMSQWSVVSWAYMTLPMFWPWWLFLAAKTLCLVLDVGEVVFRKRK